MGEVRGLRRARAKVAAGPRAGAEGKPGSESPPPPARSWPPSQGREVVLMVEEGMGLEIGGPGGSRG